MPQNRPQIASRKREIFAALVLFVLMSQAACAGDLPLPRLVDIGTASLSLTPAQQQKMTALENSSNTQSHALIAQIHHLRWKLSEMYETYSVDVASVRRTNQELNRVQGQLLDLRLSEQLQMRKILSPAQFAQLQAAIQKQKAADDDRHEHHEGDEH